MNDRNQTEVDVARELEQLRTENAELRAALTGVADALGVINLNARTIPDPTMDGLADISSVPLDDIENSHAALAAARSALASAEGKCGRS